MVSRHDCSGGIRLGCVLLLLQFLILDVQEHLTDVLQMSHLLLELQVHVALVFQVLEVSHLRVVVSLVDLLDIGLLLLDFSLDYVHFLLVVVRVLVGEQVDLRVYHQLQFLLVSRHVLDDLVEPPIHLLSFLFHSSLSNQGVDSLFNSLIHG